MGTITDLDTRSRLINYRDMDTKVDILPLLLCLDKLISQEVWRLCEISSINLSSMKFKSDNNLYKYTKTRHTGWLISVI